MSDNTDGFGPGLITKKITEEQGGMVDVRFETKCAHCGRPLKSAEEWSDCKRQHVLEYWWKEDPGMMKRLARDMGY